MDCTGYRELSELRDTFWIAVRKDGGTQKGEGFGEGKKREVGDIEKGGFRKRIEGP